jgi:hypothetical protein
MVFYLLAANRLKCCFVPGGLISLQVQGRYAEALSLLALYLFDC